ncbi:tripartite tricarboxylate transporter TctB family protein [Xanthobacter tagetidis]|uniref:Tripartite tricarboxylate transporter TctB family protein n=2 Tax=Xanthobacter tagetidis TaxID=60216 RepID=A0A3L6ZYD6_9HYPH|nr:tripartite tricarboxylate transporter TctB family protein [Xanthobacter tagetidis]
MHRRPAPAAGRQLTRRRAPPRPAARAPRPDGRSRRRSGSIAAREAWRRTMRIKLVRGGVDFWSGLLLVAIASAALFYISSLEIGTALDMGPGYFPLMIAAVLAVMGAVLVVRGLAVEGPEVPPMNLRAGALILGSFLVFALLLDRFGLVVAILAQTVVASFASRESVLWQSVLFGAAMAAGSVALFIWLLGLPVEVWP